MHDLTAMDDFFASGAQTVHAANWLFDVMINCCWGLILLRRFASLGNDHPVPFSTKAYYFVFSAAHGSKARNGAGERGEEQGRRRLAAG
ncbi:MAG: hypothetical protein ACLQDM_12180 [Bradyrhizobium sp.]